MITDIDIKNALLVCTEASQGPGVWAAKNDDTRAEAIERFTTHYDLARVAPGGSEVLHQVDLPIERDADGAFCFAVTGNGPHGAANARFIAGALNPEVGWQAALEEVRTVRADRDAMVHDFETMAESLADAHYKIGQHQGAADADKAAIARLGRLLVRARDMLGAIGSDGSLALRDEIAAEVGENDAPSSTTRDDGLRFALLGSISALSEALELAADGLNDSESYKEQRIRDLRDQQRNLTAIAANAAPKPKPGDLVRPDHEMAALEVGFDIAKKIVTEGDSLKIPHGELATAIRERSIPDNEIVAFAFGIILRDVMGRSVPWRNRHHVCGWCVAAAGDTDEAEAAAERFNLATAKLHTLNCSHNPLSAFRWLVAGFFDKLDAMDSEIPRPISQEMKAAREELENYWAKSEQRCIELRAVPGVDQERV